MYDTRQQNEHSINPADMQRVNKVVDRNSFREHQLTKMEQVLSIDNHTKLTDAEIADYNNYFFEELEKRDAGQSTQYKKESFKTSSDFVQAN
jgi:hypothetical protein